MMFMGKQVVCAPIPPKWGRFGPNQIFASGEDLQMMATIAAGPRTEGEKKWLHDLMHEMHEYELSHGRPSL